MNRPAQAPSSPRLLAAATALLVAACTSPDRAPTPAVSAKAASESPAAKPAPSASAEGRAVCLPEQVDALECYPEPRTRDFPDCRQFTLTRQSGDASCQPERLSLEATGYQAIFDELVVKVIWEAGPPQRAKLVHERVVSSMMGFHEKPGTELATLVFKEGAPSELLLGPGARSYTKAVSAKIVK